MKLIGTEIGRVVHLVVPDEVRPEHGLDLAVLYREVAARYGFARIPHDFDTFNQPAGAKFELGHFHNPRGPGEIPILELALFNDGLIGACADTNLADLLLDDAIAWLIETKLIRRPITQRPRTYFSNVVVWFDRIQATRFARIVKTTEKLDAALQDQYGFECATSLARLTLSADPRLLPPGSQQTSFTIERRANVAYDQNWFWSNAPVPIDAHLRLLEGLEADLASMP